MITSGWPSEEKIMLQDDAAALRAQRLNSIMDGPAPDFDYRAARLQQLIESIPKLQRHKLNGTDVEPDPEGKYLLREDVLRALELQDA